MKSFLSFTRRGLAGLVFGAAAFVAAAVPQAQAQVKELKDIRIEFVTHGQANDVYWTVVKNGMLAAAKQLGVKVNYQAPETWDVVRMRQMLEAAIASKPDGLVISIPDPTALEAPVKAAKAAGIPVVVVDTGEEQVGPWGLDLFVGGGSEYDNGVHAGELMGKAGVKEGVCLNHEVGNVSLDKRCEGYAKGLGESGGKSQVLAITMDPTDATRRLEAFLKANPGTNGIITLGPTVASPILKMLTDNGMIDKVKMGTFDLSAEVLDAIDKGKMMFGIDNQQFLMGYLPVVFLASKAQFKTFPTDTVRTGPAFITKDDAAAVRDLSKAGFR